MAWTQIDQSSPGRKVRWIVKFLVLLGWGVGIVGLAGCAPKLYINETYRKALTVPIVDGTVALDDGTQIEVKAILTKEKVTPPPTKLEITRLLGSYVLVADGFQHVWMIRPATGGTEGSYYQLEVPQSGALRGVRLQHNTSHRCVTLLLGDGVGGRWYIHASGQIARKCNDVAKD